MYWLKPKLAIVFIHSAVYQYSQRLWSAQVDSGTLSCDGAKIADSKQDFVESIMTSCAAAWFSGYIINLFYWFWTEWNSVLNFNNGANLVILRSKYVI